MKQCKSCGADCRSFKKKDTCNSCYKKEEYERLKKQNRCPHCYKENDRVDKVLCSACATKDKQYTAQNPDRLANHSLKSRYGITLQDKQSMYEEQKGLCALCFEPLLANPRRSHVDHDHKNSTVRALLHKRCNILVGYLEDKLFPKAVEYLEKYKWQPMTRSHAEPVA